MNYELFFIFLVFISLFGLTLILHKKIPILKKLVRLRKYLMRGEKSTFLKVKEQIEKLNPFRGFSLEIFLQKILTKIRIIALKIENIAIYLIQKLRIRIEKRKNIDKYWRNIKMKIKKIKKKPA